MEEIIEVYNFAEEKNYQIKNVKIGTKATCLSYKENNIILIDYDLLENQIDEKMVLLEEIAHLEVGFSPTAPFSCDYCNKLQRSKNEYRALKWIVHKYIPYTRFVDLITQFKSYYDIADKLNIPMNFLEKCFQVYEEDLYYLRKGGNDIC